MKTKPVIISVLAILFIIVFGIKTTYAGPTAAITLSATPLSVPADGVSSIAITAILVDSPGKNPVDIGTTATFTTITGPGNFRNLTNTITETVAAINQKSDGAYIVVSLMSESNISGTTQISCTSNGVTQYITVSFDAIGSLSLTALPTWIPADGKSTSTLTATIKNTAGLPVAVGTDVRFITTLGLLSSGLESPATDITVQVSNGTGIVSVSLIAGIVPGIAEVTCISNGMTQTVTVAMGVGSITLTASPTSLPADGYGSSEIKAILKNSAGVAVSVGTSVTFTLIFPVIPPEVPPKTPPTFSNGTNTITLGTIDATGIVTTSLIAGTASGLAEVVCSSGGLTQSASISLGSLPIASITLEANPGSIPADGYSSSTITATVLDVSGNPLNKDSVPVTFTTNLGHFSNGSKTITVSTIKVTGLSDAGKVVVSLIAETTSGVALVICESGSVTQSTNVTIGSSAEVASITLAANPTSLPADGVTSSTLTATVLDISGNPLNKDNILIKFTTTLGHFSNGTNTITVATMWVDTIYTTRKPGMVLVSLIAGTTPGIARITCESGNVTQATNVTIGTSGQVASITLSANPTSLPVGDSSSTITAELLDTSGNLINLSNIPVTFTTDLGHFSNGTQKIVVTSQSTTAVPGKVVVSLIAGTTTGTAHIVCRSGDVDGVGGVTQTTNVTIGSSGPVPSLIVLSAAPTSVLADNIASSTITAKLYDQNNKQITNPGIPVEFIVSGVAAHFSNNLITIKVSTDATGTAAAFLYSSVIGTAGVSASTNGVTSNSIFVIFTAPPQPTPTPQPTPAPYLAGFLLSADSPSVPVADLKPATISVQLYDQFGKALASPGVSVDFTTTPVGLAHFSNNLTTIRISTDSSGKATALLYSSIVGTAAVSATVGSLTTNPIYVNFTGPSSTADIVLSNNCTGSSCDGSSITATLYDRYGRAVSSGEAVNFTTTIGHFSNKLSAITAYTNSVGVASVVIYSGGVIGTAQVSASSNGITRYIDVKFTGVGQPADIVLSLNCNGSCDTSSYFTISATLYDKNRQLVSSGVEVDFTTTIGYFSNKLNAITAYTNSDGVASVVFYSGGVIGTAQIIAHSYGITRYLDVLCNGVGTPTYISLSAAHNWIPADGYSYTAITAVILDSAAQPVAAGTVVKFTTTSLGVFENGKTTYLTATPDAKGTLTVYLRSASTIDITGAAMITCSSGSIMQSITVDIVRLEYETEPNNDMLQADGICFRNVFLGQLSSPYEEDWYTFTITESSRIGINFITTAAPADAKCDSGTTTVGTWKVDIRDSNNNVLMSYHNVDCTFDNGIWETGVVPQGTYYVVVYCPRLGGTGDIYLSDPYYMRVFNDFYFPCVDRDQSVNSATMSQKSSAYQLHLPIIDPVPYLWADFQYDPIQATSLMFKLTNYGVITNLEGYRACNLSTLSMIDGNYVLHIPLLIFDGVSYRADLIYVPTTDGLIWFMLSGFWAN
jgi:hypothetical protein